MVNRQTMALTIKIPKLQKNVRRLLGHPLQLRTIKTENEIIAAVKCAKKNLFFCDVWGEKVAN
jgi:hypothetical protein